MNPPRLALALAVWASIASLPANAEAARIAPPGNAGLNQYTETLPGPGGNEKTGESHRSPAEVLGKRNAEKLRRLGAEGRAAARLAAETVPPRRSEKGRGLAGGGASASSGLQEVLKQATGASGSGGMSILLPLTIAAAIVGGGAYTAARRRAARGP